MPSIRTLAALIVTFSAAPAAFAIDPYEPDTIGSVFRALATHGTRQHHDLDGTGDVDYVVLDPAPRRSYEASVTTAGRFTADLSRRDAADAVQQWGAPLIAWSIRSPTGTLMNWSPHTSSVLNWIESGVDAERTRYLRVDANGAVHTAADSQYTLQLRETTLYCPRYNNTGGQATVLIVQRVGVQERDELLPDCIWTADFYDQAYAQYGHTLNGSYSGVASSSSLGPNGMFVVATASVVPGTSGSIQIAHTCGYGRVQAKAVSVEPSTGFTFDTTCSTRPE